ncbi:MAG: GreA/GreB family elongation factor [Thiotrichales bacterium]|nr:GreA/GreB family elongation factor [Thiotrichales bacterium]
MNYITAEGYRRVSAELVALWKVKRPEIVRAISAAAAEGDRSENAEYIYRKKELRETDRKIRHLEKHLKDIKVVQDKPKNRNKVFFGARVSLCGESLPGGECQYRLVGMIESRPEVGEISIHSPVAKALLGKELGDEVVIVLPSGEKRLVEIVEIDY